MKEKLYCSICGTELTGNQRKYCSNACKQKQHYLDKKNNPNSYHSQTKRAIRRKMGFIERLGGKCSRCGYNTNLSALHFHHIDSSTKEFGLDSRALSNHSMKILEKELDKCILLCSNCHAEEHYKEMDYKYLIENKEKFL